MPLSGCRRRGEGTGSCKCLAPGPAYGRPSASANFTAGRGFFQRGVQGPRGGDGVGAAARGELTDPAGGMLRSEQDAATWVPRGPEGGPTRCSPSRPPPCPTSAPTRCEISPRAREASPFRRIYSIDPLILDTASAGDSGKAAFRGHPREHARWPHSHAEPGPTDAGLGTHGDLVEGRCPRPGAGRRDQALPWPDTAAQAPTPPLPSPL